MFKLNLLSVNPTKWPNILKQLVGNLPTNCLSVFDHFVKLALKDLIFRTILTVYSILLMLIMHTKTGFPNLMLVWTGKVNKIWTEKVIRRMFTLLTIYFAMLENGETHFTNLATFAVKFLNCLTILRHCEVKG